MNVLYHLFGASKAQHNEKNFFKVLELFVKWIMQIEFSYLKFLSYRLQDASSSDIIMIVTKIP